MKKFLFVLMDVFVFAGAFAAGENVPTSKSYVDSKLGEKQDTIPANDGAARVLTNTGTAGEYGIKGIYDANGEYATQAQNLVDAATMNAGVQNAIDSEFQCIEWLDPNDHSSDCLLMDIRGTTERRSPNLFDISKIPSRAANMIPGNGAINNNGDGTLTVQPVYRNSAVWTERKLSQLAPDLVIGKTYILSLTTTGTQKFIYLGSPVAETWLSGTSKTITQNMLDASVYFYGSYPDLSPQTISNIQITEGTTATPYVPYGNLYLPNGE